MEPTWYEAQAIRDDGLKVLITTESNPALTEMGQNAWQQAVKEKDGSGEYRLELLVSFEIMMSETAKYADLVLPDKSFFERWELLYMPWWYNFGHGIALRQPVVKAPGECRHSNEIFIELGKRIVPEYFQFENDIAYYDIQLAGLGLSVEKLQQMGGLWSPGTMGFRKYEKAGGFGTPSGKIQLHWEDLQNLHGIRTGHASNWPQSIEKTPTNTLLFSFPTGRFTILAQDSGHITTRSSETEFRDFTRIHF